MRSLSHRVGGCRGSNGRQAAGRDRAESHLLPPGGEERHPGGEKNAADVEEELRRSEEDLKAGRIGMFAGESEVES
jgi:hypothetical protein